MKNSYAFRILSVAIFAAAFILQHANGQGIKMNLFCMSNYQSIPSSSKNHYYGFGYEQNVGDKIALSLEYNKGYDLSDDGSFFTEYRYSVNGLGYSFEWAIDANWYEFAYQSKYLFSDNDYNSFYFSSGVSYRKVSVQIITGNINYDPGYAAEASQYSNLQKSSVTLIPLTFKMGYRNSMDGWFGDYFFGVNFIPGASDKGTGNDTFDRIVTAESFRGISICWGVAFGVGWAD